MMILPNTLSVLTPVSEQGSFLLFKHSRDVDVVVRGESQRLAACIDLKEIQVRSGFQGQTSPNRTHTGHLVIHVSIYWPVREDYGGTLFRQDLLDLVDARSSEIRRTVNLSGEARFHAQNLASRLAL